MGFGLSIEPQLWALLFAMVRIGAAASANTHIASRATVRK